MKRGVGTSTNSRAELLSLWTLLYFAKLIGLPCLHILGDSYAIINWLNRKSKLFSLNLDGWCLNIRELESYFLHYDASHVYQEHNVIADGLSKDALSLASSLLHVSKFSKGECVLMDTL